MLSVNLGNASWFCWPVVLPGRGLPAKRRQKKNAVEAACSTLFFFRYIRYSEPNEPDKSSTQISGSKPPSTSPANSQDLISDDGSWSALGALLPIWPKHPSQTATSGQPKLPPGTRHVSLICFTVQQGSTGVPASLNNNLITLPSPLSPHTAYTLPFALPPPGLHVPPGLPSPSLRSPPCPTPGLTNAFRSSALSSSSSN